LIVPFVAGSLVDLVPRIVFNGVSTAFHQTFIVENRNRIDNRRRSRGQIGAGRLHDLVQRCSQAMMPFPYKDLPIDPRHDFVTVAPLAAYANVLVVSPAKGNRNLRQFVDWAKPNAGL
jgi:tripartite-type tricarboxylate transporter receptor subunit TctC